MSASQTVYWPFDPALVTEEFGTRDGNHGGIDGGMPVGTPLIASFDGVVVANFNDGASGSMWVGSQRIDANGPALITDLRRDDGLISRVAHLSAFAASPGQRVRAGDVIAYSGNTGFTIGPHAHWETRWDRRLGPGAWVNPRSFNPQIFAGSTTPDGQEEDEEMAEKIWGVVHNAGGPGSVQTVIIGQPSSGWKFKYTTRVFPEGQRNPENEKWANFFGDKSFETVTDKSMLDAWEQSLDEKRQGK